jgi:aspartyl-tRNA(Asn)/glutamyl-tRNA(Gln) amidotransferase subunit C
MSLSPDDVKRVARLARIAVAEQEVAPVQQQLVGIFKMIEEMGAIDTKNIEPMSHAQDLSLRLREDKATEPDQHQLFQSIAPQVEADLYLVPKVIE